MNSNDTEAMVKAAEDLLRMESINSTQWRTLSEKAADFAAQQIATQTAELQKRLAEAEAFINGLERDARRTAHNSSYRASRAEARYLLDQIEKYRAMTCDARYANRRSSIASRVKPLDRNSKVTASMRLTTGDNTMIEIAIGVIIGWLCGELIGRIYDELR